MYKVILHATDLSENHYKLCEQAVQLAHFFQAEIHFLHVVATPISFQWAQSLGFAELATPVKEGAQVAMTALGEALNIPTACQHIEVGSIYTHVLNKIKTLACDLVIIGRHASNVNPTFLGSTAHAIVQHAPCAVLTL